MAKQPLPRQINQLTPQWLTGALDERFPGISVNTMENVQIIHGTSTKIRVKVSYEQYPGPNGPPTTLCIKGGFDDRLREFKFLPTLYQSEGNFFRHLAPKLTVPLMRCWYADAEEGQGIVIFDDLVAKGATFPRPVRPWSIDRVKSALETLATLHAQTWNIDAKQYPWLQKASDQLRNTTEGQLKDHVWNEMLQRPDAHFIPAAQRDRERIRRALNATADLIEKGTHCLVHFDATINNAYLDPQTGDPRFCDWQCACIGPFMLDVPYHIAGALSVEDRRKHEKNLFAHYLAALKAKGGPAYTVEELWLDYRCHEMGMGWLWCTCSYLMQPPETVAAMTERHATAVADHNTLEALEV
jgi:hypothetical protein